MGTRSVVAVPVEGGWKGRYVHWDGYPSGVGAATHVIVSRDGYEAAVQTLTEDNYGWSTLTAEETPTLGVGSDDGRFRAIAGYGIAYTTEQGQSSPDEWITAEGDDYGAEWAYVLHPDRIEIFERRYGTPDADDGHGTGMFGFGASDTESGGYWQPHAEVPYASEYAVAE